MIWLSVYRDFFIEFPLLEILLLITAVLWGITASIHACIAVKNSVAYTVSKGGIKQMTQALALELGPLGIRVNAVAPGLIATDMTRKTTANPEHLQRFLERVPLNRRGEPDDVVDAICFLAGDSAAYITGVTLPVDGGYLAN